MFAAEPIKAPCQLVWQEPKIDRPNTIIADQTDSPVGQADRGLVDLQSFVLARQTLLPTRQAGRGPSICRCDTYFSVGTNSLKRGSNYARSIGNAMTSWIDFA